MDEKTLRAKVQAQDQKCRRLAADLRKETARLQDLERELVEHQEHMANQAIGNRILGWLRSPIRKEPLALPPPEEDDGSE